MLMNIYQGFFANIFKTVWDWINKMVGLIPIDKLIDQALTYFHSLDNVFKLLIFVFTAIILVLGIFSFIKKLFKLFVLIVVIFAIYFIVKMV